MKSNGRRKKKTKRKPYQKPTATQLSSEEVKAKLRRLAQLGDKQAQEMLRFIPGEQPQQNSEDDDDHHDKKKSA